MLDCQKVMAVRRRKNFDHTLSRFGTIPYCDGQTDRQIPFDSKRRAYT